MLRMVAMGRVNGQGAMFMYTFAEVTASHMELIVSFENCMVF